LFGFNLYLSAKYRVMKKQFVFSLFILNVVGFSSYAQTSLLGAWERMIDDETKAVSIVADKYFSVAFYKDQEFVSTFGGRWESIADDQVRIHYEWHTAEPENVGSSQDISISVSGDELISDGNSWVRIDDGTPGVLNDAWLMTGRKRDGVGEMQIREIGPRKTMKILSGTRFQWIAYNSDTGQFSGTGGGTYSTVDGVYTENIEFFSRDNSRVGASLPFQYDLQDGGWHHSGKSSRGDPIYEVWSSRSTLE